MGVASRERHPVAEAVVGSHEDRILHVLARLQHAGDHDSGFTVGRVAVEQRGRETGGDSGCAIGSRERPKLPAGIARAWNESRIEEGPAEDAPQVAGYEPDQRRIGQRQIADQILVLTEALVARKEEVTVAHDGAAHGAAEEVIAQRWRNRVAAVVEVRPGVEEIARVHPVVPEILVHGSVHRVGAGPCDDVDLPTRAPAERCVGVGGDHTKLFQGLGRDDVRYREPGRASRCQPGDAHPLFVRAHAVNDIVVRRIARTGHGGIDPGAAGCRRHHAGRERHKTLEAPAVERQISNALAVDQFGDRRRPRCDRRRLDGDGGVHRRERQDEIDDNYVAHRQPETLADLAEPFHPGRERVQSRHDAHELVGSLLVGGCGLDGAGPFIAQEHCSAGDDAARGIVHAS